VVGNARTQGTARFDGSTTLNGNTNITGSFQINGTAGYVLTEVVSYDIPYGTSGGNNSNSTCSTISGFIKPADEIWECTVNCECTYGANDVGGFVIMNANSALNPMSGGIIFAWIPRNQYSPSNGARQYDNINCTFIIPLGTVFGTIAIPEAITFRARSTLYYTVWSFGYNAAWSQQPTQGFIPSMNKLTIKKFKTA